MDDLTVILYGKVSPGELRERAVYDFKKINRVLAGDHEMFAHTTVRSARWMHLVGANMDEIQAVLRAAVQSGTLTSRRQVVGYHIYKPVVYDIDTLTVSFRPVLDKGLLLSNFRLTSVPVGRTMGE